MAHGRGENGEWRNALWRWAQAWCWDKVLSCAPGETLKHHYWCPLTRLVSPKTSQCTDSKGDWNPCASLSFPLCQWAAWACWAVGGNLQPQTCASHLQDQRLTSQPRSTGMGLHPRPTTEAGNAASSTWLFWGNGSGKELQGPRTKCVHGWSTPRGSSFAEDSDKEIYNLSI